MKYNSHGTKLMKIIVHVSFATWWQVNTCLTSSKKSYISELVECSSISPLSENRDLQKSLCHPIFHKKSLTMGAAITFQIVENVLLVSISSLEVARISLYISQAFSLSEPVLYHTNVSWVGYFGIGKATICWIKYEVKGSYTFGTSHSWE